MLNKLSPIFFTDISPVGQMKSDIGALITLLKFWKSNSNKYKYNDDLKGKVFNQLQNYKLTINKVLQMKLDTEKIDKMIDDVENKNIDDTLDILNELKEYLQDKLNIYTLNYMEDKHLLPIDERYIEEPKIKGKVEHAEFMYFYN